MSTSMSTPLQQVPRETLLSMFEIITKISATDNRIRAGMNAGEFAFSLYPIRGQECIPAGVSVNLRDDDYMVTTYRCLHDIIGKGVPLKELLSEMMGRSTGTSKGKGGPMHISDPNSGLMVTTGIVGAGVPIANGLALAAKLKGTDQVAVTNFGDGSTSIGATHEAFNMASVWELPVVFICQNNQYGEHTARAGYTKTEVFADRAAGYGMRGVVCDGNDPVSVFETVGEAVARARAGEGPTFVECVTYRLQGHTYGADTSYMDPVGLAEAWANDPIPKYRARLIESGLFTEDELAGIEAATTAEVEDAINYAKASPIPDASELLTDVFEDVRSIPR